jgi:hypothetical protein
MYSNFIIACHVLVLQFVFSHAFFIRVDRRKFCMILILHRSGFQKQTCYLEVPLYVNATILCF